MTKLLPCKFRGYNHYHRSLHQPSCPPKVVTHCIALVSTTLGPISVDSAYAVRYTNPDISPSQVPARFTSKVSEWSITVSFLAPLGIYDDQHSPTRLSMSIDRNKIKYFGIYDLLQSTARPCAHAVHSPRMASVVRNFHQLLTCLCSKQTAS